MFVKGDTERAVKRGNRCFPYGIASSILPKSRLASHDSPVHEQSTAHVHGLDVAHHSSDPL